MIFERSYRIFDYNTLNIVTIGRRLKKKIEKTGIRFFEKFDFLEGNLQKFYHTKATKLI